MATMPDTGVLKTDSWSIKAWKSMSRNAYLVQVEHDIPERGGWIRAWLVDTTGSLCTYPELAEAVIAIESFADHPQWNQCREFAGV